MKLAIIICLFIAAGYVVALTASEARTATNGKVVAFASGARVLAYVRERIVTEVNYENTVHECVDIQPNDQLFFPRDTAPTKRAAWLAAATTIWHHAKDHLLRDGFRVEADYLQETVVAGEHPTYKQRYAADGRVVQDLVCANGGQPRGDIYYGREHMTCVQSPRITICWDMGLDVVAIPQ